MRRRQEVNDGQPHDQLAVLPAHFLISIFLGVGPQREQPLVSAVASSSWAGEGGLVLLLLDEPPYLNDLQASAAASSR